MKNFELLRYLKKWWFLIMVVTAAGCLLVYRFVSSNQQYTATAVIQYTNVNASEGLNADGTELDPSEITSAAVINRTIEDLGLTSSTESIRSRVSVQEVIPEDAIIFTDVGWNKNGVAQEFDITLPGTIHHSSGLATMGFGPSAVLGGKLAAPDKIVLNLTGDGGFGINPSCLAAAVEHGIACTWVVMNNSAFGTIAGLENANYKTKFGTVFHTPDGESYSPCWADVAKAYGVDSICISSADEFKPALEKAIEANKAGKPFLVEAPMENIVVPTPGCWNINDIYSPNELVKEGKLVKKENGQYVAPSHSKSHDA